MKDFIHNLYSNPNFALYLGLIIIALLVAFFVVFFLGKKDKEKLEETKRLETIANDAFSEVSTPVAVEAKEEKVVENVQNVMPAQVKTVETGPVLPSEPVKSITAPVTPVVSTPVSEPALPKQNVETPAKVFTEAIPTVIKAPIVEEQKPEEPVIFPDLIQLPSVEGEEAYKSTSTAASYEEITKSIDNDLKEMENKASKPVLNEEIEPAISIPKVDSQTASEPPKTPIEDKKAAVVNEVFSSVYVPRRDPVMFDDTAEIELPRLR